MRTKDSSSLGEIATSNDWQIPLDLGDTTTPVERLGAHTILQMAKTILVEELYTDSPSRLYIGVLDAALNSQTPQARTYAIMNNPKAVLEAVTGLSEYSREDDGNCEWSTIVDRMLNCVLDALPGGYLSLNEAVRLGRSLKRKEVSLQQVRERVNHCDGYEKGVYPCLRNIAPDLALSLRHRAQTIDAIMKKGLNT